MLLTTVTMGSTEQYGQYTILGRIGEGAHGIVFKAKHIEVYISNHDLS